MANKEVLKYFKEDEIQKLHQKIEKDVSFKETYDKIKDNPEYRLSQLEESIETKTESNFEKRFEAFKKAVEKAEKEKKESIPKSVNDVKKVLATKKDKAIDDATQKVLDKTGLGKLGKMWEKISGFFDNVSKAFDKGFLVGLGVLFGFMKFEDIEEDKKDEKKGEGKEKEENASKIEHLHKSDFEKLKKPALEKTGFSILKGFSGVELKKGNNSNAIFKTLKEKKYSTIHTLLYKYINGNKIDTNKLHELKGIYGIDKNISGEEIFDVLKILSNKYVNIIYSQRLKSEKLKNICTDKDGKIIDKYKKIFTSEDDIKKLEKGLLDYRNLDIKTISILLSLSYSSFMIAGIGELKKIGVDAFNYITEDGSINEEFKKELDSRKKKLLPLDFFTNVITSGSNSINLSEEQLKKEQSYNELEQKEKDKIIKLINFKDNLLSGIKEKQIFNLGIKDFSNRIKNSLTLTNIISLYMLLDGKIDFNGDTINKSIYYSWLINISSENSLNNKLNGDIIHSLSNLLLDKKDTSILSKNDKDIIMIVLGKVLGISLGVWEKHISNTINLLSLPIAIELEKNGVPKSESTQIAILLEGGLTLTIGYILRKSLAGKILMFSGVLLPIVGFIIKEYTVSTIKKSISDDMFDEFNTLIAGSEYKKNGKTVIVNSLQDIEDFQEDPDEYIEKQKETSSFTIIPGAPDESSKKKINNPEKQDNFKLEYSKKEGVIIEFKGDKFVIDTTSIYDGNENVDYFDGKEINFHQFDKEEFKKGEKIIYGNGENRLELGINEIYEVLKKGEFKKGYIITEFKLGSLEQKEYQYLVLRKPKGNDNNNINITGFNKETLIDFIETSKDKYNSIKSGDLILRKIN